MKDNFYSEIGLAAVIVILLVFLLNPFNIFMPSAMLMMIVLALVLVFAVFASVIFKERSLDERESLHKLMADRNAFLAGSGIMVIGILVQSFRHEFDTWLLLALGVMVLVKIASLIYTRIKY